MTYEILKNNTGVLIHASVIEQTAKDQIDLIVAHPAIRELVAIMPDVHAGAGCVIGFTGKFKKSVIPNIVGVDIGCFTGDTKIPLLNGIQYSLKELEGKGSFYVYSVDENLNVVPGKAIALKTRTNAEIMEVVISSGEIIRCTPDHKFMLIDGKYKEAKDLKPLDSLLPLYRTYSSGDGYERIRTRDGNGILTHHMVANYFLGKRKNGIIVHHKDGLWFNNSPENIEYKNSDKHSSDHRKLKPTFGTEEFKIKRLISLQEKGFFREEFREMKKEIAMKNITKYMKENQEDWKEKIKDNGKRGREFILKNNSIRGQCECGKKVKGIGNLVQHQKYCCVHNAFRMNHKVLFTNKLDYKEDVYCLQVEKYHNFALSSGIFVHNCGVMTYKLQTKDIDFAKLDKFIRENIPTGFSSRSQDDCRPIHFLYGYEVGDFVEMKDNAISFIEDHKLKGNPILQIGTLGGGNHFIEIEIGRLDELYLTVHSGSRNFGLQVATFYQRMAKELMSDMNISVPKDLEYLPLSAGGKEYLEMMKVAQKYAYYNRLVMIRLMLKHLGEKYEHERIIESVHNYISFKDAITRKGAISAQYGEKVVIPLHMGAGIVLGTGKGNKDYNYSAPHGAGRVFGRKEIKRRLEFGVISMDSFQKSMEGIFSNSITKNTIDESPYAYKTLGDIQKHLEETVNVEQIAKPIFNLKAEGGD